VRFFEQRLDVRGRVRTGGGEQRHIVTAGHERVAEQFDNASIPPQPRGGTGIHGGVSTAIRKRRALAACGGSSRKGVLAFLTSVVARLLNATRSGPYPECRCDPC